MDPIALRPRKATEIVDAAIEVYRRNPVHFMLLTTLVHAPWLILQLLWFGNESPLMVTRHLLASLMISFGTLVTYFLMSAVVVQMASDLYLGRETDVFAALRRVGWQLPLAFIAALIQAFLIGLGVALFLFPAVYWAALFFAAIPIVVLERANLFSAFGRSARLSAGLKWHILRTLGLVFIIRMLVGFGAGILITLVPNFVIQRVFTTLVSIVVYPLAGISDALLYYDVRIRREGFDIEMMAASAASVNPEAAVV